MLNNIREDDRSRLLFLKTLSDIRWTRHADATRALSEQFSSISKALKNLSESSFETLDTRHEDVIIKKMQRLETRFMSILWNVILQ
jgi:hypothetical protein